MWGNRQVVLVNGFYRKRLYVCFCVIFRENLNLKDKPNVKCFFSEMVYEEIDDFPEGSFEGDVGHRPS